MTKRYPKPPNKLSEAIELALADLAKAERSSKCVIDMTRAHDSDGDRCTMCFAGCVMRGTLGVPDDENAWLYERQNGGDFPYWWQRTFHALDYARRSMWMSAQVLFGSECASTLLPTVPAYDIDRRGFKRAMRKAVKVLREHGL